MGRTFCNGSMSKKNCFRPGRILNAHEERIYQRFKAHFLAAITCTVELSTVELPILVIIANDTALILENFCHTLLWNKKILTLNSASRAILQTLHMGRSTVANNVNLHQYNVQVSRGHVD